MLLTRMTTLAGLGAGGGEGTFVFFSKNPFLVTYLCVSHFALCAVIS